MLLYIMSGLGSILQGGETPGDKQMGGIKAGVDVGASVLGGRRRRSSKRKARKSRKSRRKSRKARRRRSRRH